MRRLLPAVATLAAVALAAAPAPVRTQPVPRALSPRAESFATIGEIAEAPGDVALQRTVGRNGVVPPGAWARMRAEALSLPATTGQWKLHGPYHIGGRVLDVVIDPKAKDSIYVASATGGVWHSSDAGMTFESRWPKDNTQTIGALAIAPDGTLYAGTGEAGPGGGSLTYGGDGVYRSRDAGKTWQNVGLTGTERIGRIVVDPADPQRVWVAANGPLFNEGGERGLYLSTDGGDTWTLKHPGTNTTTGAVDVALAPDDSDTVYVTMWDRLRHPDSRDYTGGGTALYRSTDGGETFEVIGQQFFGPNLEHVGRLGVAVAPGGIVYVLSSTLLGATAGFYVSTDGGDTFTLKSVDDALLTGGFVYAWWFGRVYVDPKDPQHVFATGVNLPESKDGGATWTSPGGIHADQHGIAWDPNVADRVYLGNDGGVWRSDDNGTTWTHGTYMPWNQLFSVDVSQQRPERVVGGLQDNGGVRSWDSEGDVGKETWNDITGGDGTEMRINPQNDEIVYGCSQYGACGVSTNGGNNRQSFENDVLAERKNWLTPIEFDPSNPSLVYTATWQVWRSRNDAGDWEPISPDLTDGEQGSTEANPLFRNYNTVSTIATTTEDVGFVLAGTDDGHLWYTHDVGQAFPQVLTTWTEVNDPDLPKHYVTSTAIDQQNPDVAYVTYSGFRWGDTAATVFRSTDRGVSWEDISGDLPHAPVNKVLPIGDALFVGTDVGVFMSKNGGRSWARVGGNMAMSPIWDLAYQAKTHSLYAANFGRGAWSIPLTGISAVPPVPPVVPPVPPRKPGGGGSTPATGLPATLPLAALGAAVAALAATRRRRALTD
ncbi:MAG TPA: hypothetical protein VGX28_04695 [Frankiaceae bacterium]|jgi:hypothetical protein|nr:hypothetical protein [Frankiaceae bacterium]